LGHGASARPADSVPVEWLRLERVGVEAAQATDYASSVVASVKAGAADQHAAVQAVGQGAAGGG
jgi:hypothetical protein